MTTVAHVAVVEHEYGMDVLYVGLSEANAAKALADYCRNWWYDEEVDFDSDIEDPNTAPDLDVIKAYFNNENVLNKGERSTLDAVPLQDAPVDIAG
jgi:hypothetical protein